LNLSRLPLAPGGKLDGFALSFHADSGSSIDEVSVRALGGSRLETSSMDFLKCQTATATPAEPGGLPLTLGGSWVVLIGGSTGRQGSIRQEGR
jgi:hypothetical protein